MRRGLCAGVVPVLVVAVLAPLALALALVVALAAAVALGVLVARGVPARTVRGF